MLQKMRLERLMWEKRAVRLDEIIEHESLRYGWVQTLLSLYPVISDSQIDWYQPSEVIPQTEQLVYGWQPLNTDCCRSAGQCMVG
jgi:hypothetical protein